jgi:hypothetical protein
MPKFADNHAAQEELTLKRTEAEIQIAQLEPVLAYEHLDDDQLAESYEDAFPFAG